MRNETNLVRSQPKRIYSDGVFKSFILMAYKSCFRLLSYLSIGILIFINRRIGFPELLCLGLMKRRCSFQLPLSGHVFCVNLIEYVYGMGSK
jgi:hypothetical protein